MTTGQLALPIVKDDAGNAVRHIQGVTNAVDNIEVLPLSPSEDRLRLAVFHAMYGDPILSGRYGLDASPAIHIIVKNSVTKLEGVVAK